MTHSRTRRLSALTLTVAITALCVAACGSSNTTSSSSAAASASSSSSGSSGSGAGFNRSKFAACLKSHGVTLPARPAGAGGGEGGGPAGSGSSTHRRGGFFFGGGAGTFANNPKMRAALQACGGGRGGFSGRRFTLSHAAVTKFVACVKAHGYNLPAPNFSGKGGIFPTNIESNKKFQAAARSCASDLRPAGAPAPGASAPPGAGGSATSTT